MDEILEVGEDDLEQHRKSKAVKLVENKEKSVAREKKKHSLFRSWKK
jgi:hypothetical protein